MYDAKLVYQHRTALGTLSSSTPSIPAESGRIAFVMGLASDWRCEEGARRQARQPDLFRIFSPVRLKGFKKSYKVGRCIVQIGERRWLLACFIILFQVCP
jgi:hypothetical protein